MFNLMQINIAGANQSLVSFEQRCAAIVAAIDEHLVDIVAVQAGRSAAGDDAPLDALAAALPEHRYRAALAGIGVLSRVPLGSIRFVPLTIVSPPDDATERALLIAELPERGLSLAVAYFSWVEAQALRNVEETLRALAGHEAVVLVGDLNQTPRSNALHRLAAAGFVDAWQRLHPGAEGWTYPVGDLWGRLDHVLERGSAPRIAAITRIGAEPAAAFSDHAALIARVGP